VIGRYLNEKLEMRARVFNVLCLTGAILGVFIAIANAITGAGITNVVLNLLSSLAAVALVVYANRTGRFHACYLITIIVVFVAFFSAMFFTAGGYHSGMPSFFVFALIFTVFMLDGLEMFLVASLEMALYVGLCLYAYYRPESVYAFDSEWGAAMDVIVGFVASSVFLGAALLRIHGAYMDTARNLAEKNALLELADRRNTEFLGSIAHELKTPLSVTSGYAQESGGFLAGFSGLAEPEDHSGISRAERKMKLIASEAERMALILSQVLDAARIDEGRMRFDMKPVSLSLIVQNTQQTYYPVFSKNNNALEIQRGDGSPTVICDAARITQVLVNLIANADRHTRDGKITVSVSQSEDFAEVTVTDTGDGIPPERVTDIFARLKSPEGAGLGLYICRHIVESHGGVISVESAQGSGTAVRFTLPLQTIPAQPPNLHY
jgi:signal transduction histidine kinase